MKKETNFQNRLNQLSPLIFVLSLVPLHASIFIGPSNSWGKILFIHHLALFLVWLPEWKQKISIPLSYIFSVSVVGAMSWFFLNSLFLTLWIALLITFSIERFHSSRLQTITHIISSSYLFAILYLITIPHITHSIAAQPSFIFFTSIPLVIAICSAIASSMRQSENIDKTKYSPTVYLWPVSTVLASVLLILECNARYHLSYSLSAAIGLTLAIALTGMCWMVLNARTNKSSNRPSTDFPPLEGWLLALSDTTDNLQIPEDYLTENLANLSQLPWVTGCVWKAYDYSGNFGEKTEFKSTLNIGEIRIALYGDKRHSAVELRNSQLLLRTLKIGFESKVREQTLKKNSYLEAIYETGARVTHDVKNVLQSMNTLTSAAAGSTPEQAVELQLLFQNQLPHLAQRLERTLSKLQDPEGVSRTFQIGRIWWENLKLQYAGRDIQFVEDLTEDHLIPRDLFDRVAQNLLENAIRKQQSENGIKITIKFTATKTNLTFSVCDTGSPVSREIAKTLLQRPIESTGGFGIGLYQASKQANQEGYVLDLISNQQAKVCFALYAARTNHSAATNAQQV